MYFFQIILLCFIFSCFNAAPVIINLGDTLILNFTQPTMSGSDLTTLMNLCASNNVCSYAWGLLFGGQNAQDAFNGLLNVNPPIPLPMKNYFGIGLINNTVVGDANTQLEILMMVYAMLVPTPHCRYDEVQTVVVPSTSICTRDPKLPTFTIANNFNLIYILLFLVILISVILTYCTTRIMSYFSRSTSIIEQKTILN